MIDPLKLEAYNVTAGELIGVVTNNNLLIAAGEVETAQGTFAVKIPSSFDDPRDIYDLPVKMNGDSVVTLGDIATIRLTFEDREGTARFNGVTTVALQVVKRKGFNLIDTAALIDTIVEEERASWVPELQAAVQVGTSNDQSTSVGSMVRQLEGAVLTAIALVMILVLAALGIRPALLVGFAIPTSFLLCFALLAVMEIIKDGAGPMEAYTDAAKRMFWPIISSTGTTLCAFLPMLFWPGVPGQFMGMLPVTLIFVLSASLIVALVYLPVMGGVTGRVERWISDAISAIANMRWYLHIAVLLAAIVATGLAAQAVPFFFGFIGKGFGAADPSDFFGSLLPNLTLSFGGLVATVLALGLGIAGAVGAVICYRRTAFGKLMNLIVANPLGPLVSIGAVFVTVCSIFLYFGANNNGVEFFVESEPEQAIVYVRARGNLSLHEKDALVLQAEQVVLDHPGVYTAFAFAGVGGLNANTGGATAPRDTIGQIQLETIPWDDRADRPDLDGDLVLAQLQSSLDQIPGIKTEILAQSRGPASGKPVHLRLSGDNWEDLINATATARAQFDTTAGLTQIRRRRRLCRGHGAIGHPWHPAGHHAIRHLGRRDRNSRPLSGTRSCLHQSHTGSKARANRPDQPKALL